MTDRTFEDIKRHAASLWVGEFADETPIDVFGSSAPTMMAVWFRDRGFRIGNDSELQAMARSCRDAARMMRRVTVQEFHPGQDG